MRMQRNVKLLQYFTFLSGMLFFIPIILPYYRDEIGLGFKELMITEAVFAAMLVLLEVPSGWISDVWKRKYVLVLAMVFDIIGHFMIILADGLWMAIFAQVLVGVAFSLISGTNSAMLYDSLLVDKKENDFGRLEGKRHGISLYAVGIASVIGGLLYPFNHDLPIYLSMATCAVALVLAFMMTEPPREKSAIQGHPLADMLSTMRYAVHGHMEVGLIILFSAALFCSTKMMMWTQQPYYIDLNIPEQYFGILMAAGFLLGGASSHFSHCLERYVSNMQTFFGSWALVFLTCIIAGILMNYVGVALLMLAGSCLYGLLSPRVNDAINKRVPSDRRATILSTMNLLTSLFFIPVSVIVGSMVKTDGLQAGLNGIALWLALAGICLGLWAFKRLRSLNIAEE